MVSAARANNDGRETRLLKISFIITAITSGFILLLFAILPELAIKMLFGAKYLSVAPYLKWFGLAMLLSALSLVLVNYFMAIHKKNYLYPFTVIVALQLILIAFFHSTIFQITMAILASSSLMLITMMIIYIYGRPKFVYSK